MGFAEDTREDDPLSDVGLFMGRVVENRDRMKTLLSSYTYREKVSVLLADQNGDKAFEFSGIFRWSFLDDGTPVRIPEVLNGDILDEKAKEKHRKKWIEDIRKDENFQEDQFNDNRDLFLNCPFDPKNYYFVGFEDMGGRALVKVEYYPESSGEKTRPVDKILEGSIITLWIDPDIFQIVQIKMERLNMDFFKFLRFFVTIDEAVVDLTMSDFDREVWLPSSLFLGARVQTFDQEHRLQYTAEYDEYGKFTVSSDMEFK